MLSKNKRDSYIFEFKPYRTKIFIFKIEMKRSFKYHHTFGLIILIFKTTYNIPFFFRKMTH